MLLFYDIVIVVKLPDFHGLDLDSVSYHAKVWLYR